MKHLAPILIAAIFCLFAQPSYAQWQSLKGPYNAYVNNVRQNSAYIFLSSPDGLYRSNNAGQWWEKPAEALQENYKLALLDANDDQLLAISRKTVFAHTFSTLHVSTNNGDTWSVIELPDDFPDYIKGGAISDDHIVLISDFKILESADGGQSWFNSPLAADLTYPSSVESYDHRIYVAGDQKLAVCDEGNTNFIWIALPPNIYPTRVYAVYQGLFVYTSSTKTLFRSGDDGQNWQTSTPAPIDFIRSEMVLLHDTLFMMNGSTIAFSKDQGLSWTTLYGGACCAPSGSFVAVSQDNLVICSTTNGTKRSKSIQGPWFDANNGLHAAQVPDLETDGSYLYAISSDRGLFRYNLLNAAWDTLNLQSFRNPEYLDACVHKGNLYAANATYPSPVGFSVGQSIDYGSHWNNVTPGWQNPMEEDTRYLSTLEQSTGAILVYGTKVIGADYGIHLSRDAGAHWTEIGLKFAAATSNSYVNSLALQGDTVWAASSSGLFFCTDDASTWVLASNGLSNSPNPLFNEFVQIYVFENLLFAVNNYGLLFRSIDQGAHWEPAWSGMDDLTNGGFHTSSIYRFLRNGQQLVALATSVFKVFVSYDEGLHWFVYPGALPDNIISSGLVLNDHIYLGTYHSGVWTNTLDDFSLQKVSGKIYWDENNNGTQDAGEKAAAGVLLSFDYYNQQTVTDSAGNYTIYTHFDGNTDVLRPNLEHLPNVVSAPQSYNVQAGTSGLNFALQNNSSIEDLEISCVLAGPLRPGKRSYYDIHVRNLGPASQNAVVELIRSPVLIQAETYPPATTISGDTIRWNLNSLAPLEARVFRMMVKIPLGTPIGVEVTSVARVSPTDSNPDNNVCTAVDTVTDALLSNVKLEAHQGTISRAQVNAGEPLIYTIPFQNIWPQTVHKLIITDQLPALLDPTTVQLLETSHPCKWSIRSNGDLEFVFDMMNLPDSASDQAASRGYLRFSVQIRKEAPFQSILRNKASLYFDLNKYISTPYTTTIIQESATTVSEAPNKTPDLRIVPNPGSGIFSIQLADGTAALGILRVFAPDGRFVWQGQAGELNLTGQAPGMYYVLLQGRDGRQYSGKLVLIRK